MYCCLVALQDISREARWSTHIDSPSQPRLSDMILFYLSGGKPDKWSIEWPMEQYDEPGMREVHHEDVGQGVGRGCNVELKGRGKLFEPIGQCDTAVSIF